MSKDLFILAKETQGKSNPIVTALLYTYCPVAAHWYVRNTPVEDVFDLMWKALEDYTSGRTMADCLRGYGLESVLPAVWEYVDKVKAFRRHHTHEMSAPETTAFFKPGKRSDSTFGIQNELEHLGGTWSNLMDYVRIWAYLMRDWHLSMKIPLGENVKWKFKKFTVSLSAPGVHSKLRVHFPVWGWDVTVGRVRSNYLGLLVTDRRQDALRFHLVNNSDLVGDKPWPDDRRPFLYALDQISGETEYINPPVGQKLALDSVMPAYRLARIGPNLPLAGLRDHQRCPSCGYRKMCFGEKGKTMRDENSQRLYQEDKRERLYLTGSVEDEPVEM